MTSLFDKIDKEEGMRKALDFLDVRYRPDQAGWQKIRCPFTANHAHGDRNPSGSVNLVVGAYKCHACGATGDWAKLLYEIEGIKVDEGVRLLGLEGHEATTGDDTADGLFLY